jgi:hypothetical protein
MTSACALHNMYTGENTWNTRWGTSNPPWRGPVGSSVRHTGWRRSLLNRAPNLKRSRAPPPQLRPPPKVPQSEASRRVRARGAEERALGLERGGLRGHHRRRRAHCERHRHQTLPRMSALVIQYEWWLQRYSFWRKTFFCSKWQPFPLEIDQPAFSVP